MTSAKNGQKHRLLPKDNAPLFLSLVFFSVEALIASFSVAYLLSRGVSLMQLLIFSIIIFAIPVLQIPFTKKVRAKVFMPLFFVLRAIAFASIVLLPLNIGILVYAVLYGLQTLWFYIPYNYLFFKNNVKHSNGLSASYMAISKSLGIIMPLLGGWIILKIGYSKFFLAGALLSILSAFIISFLPLPELSINARKGWNALNGIKALLIFEGVFWLGIVVVIPLYTLFFINDPLEFGAFLSYTTFFGVCCALIIGKFMHYKNVRRNAAILCSVLLVISIIALSFVNNLVAWVVLSSVVIFFSVILSPFFTTVFLKNSKGDASVWAVRDVLLNIGRFIGVGVMILCIYLLDEPKLAIATVGLLFLMYPILLFFKKTAV